MLPRTDQMHAGACYREEMSDIQVRAVPENLVEQAKHRAEEEGLSLSAYIRGLLEHDSDQSRQRRRADAVLDRLARTPRKVSVSPSEVRQALKATRDEHIQPVRR